MTVEQVRNIKIIHNETGISMSYLSRIFKESFIKLISW